MSLLTNQEAEQAGTLLDRARWLYRERADAHALTLISSQAEDRSVTYGEFLTQAARYAFALEQVGVQPGDLVVLVLQHGEAVLYSFWGAMLLGAVPSIFPFLTEKLDPEHYFDSVRKLVTHSEAKVVITYDELEPSLRDILAGEDGRPSHPDDRAASARRERGGLPEPQSGPTGRYGLPPAFVGQHRAAKRRDAVAPVGPEPGEGLQRVDRPPAG